MGNLSLDIVQSGIQYINQIDDNDSKAHKKFNFINLNQFEGHEGISFGTSQRLDGHEETGRLTLEAQTGYSFNAIEDNFEQRRMLRTILTFRGQPKSFDDSGLASFLDRGHDAIVSTFTQSLSEVGRKYFQENNRG